MDDREDIPARRQAEEVLRAERNRAQQYLDVAGIVMVALDTAGNITLLNRKGYEILGYEEGELHGKNWFQACVPERLRNNVLATFRDLMVGKLEPAEYVENPVLTRDGRERTIAWHNALLRGDDGRIEGTLSSGIDVTERRQAEDALREARDQLERRVEERTAELAESEAKYRQLVETTGTGYLILDDQGRVVDANAEYVRLTGRQGLDGIRGRKVLEWTAPHDLERNAREVAECLQTGAVRQLEIDYVKPDGTLAPIEINATVIDTKQGRRIVSLCRDIAERKRADRELRQNRDELQAIYDHIVDGILVVDAETEQAVRVNAAYCRMVGYSAEEMATVSPQDLHPPEAHPELAAHFDRLRQGNVARLDAFPFRCRDGSIIYADVVSGPMQYNGRPSWIAFFHDVTALKHSQAALEREHRGLKRMLQASDHERRTISYDIHDGLAQQLAGAIMQFQIHDYARDANPEQAEKAYRGGVALLQQAHAEARRIISGVRPPILDESGLVAAIAHLVHDPSAVETPKVEFQSKVRFQRLPSIVENAVYRIVQEGLSNARRHSRSSHVRIALVQRGTRLRIEIRDWGVGFNPRRMKKNHYGLAGIRERVRLLGGKCRIRSAPGQGASVTVDLPLPSARDDAE